MPDIIVENISFFHVSRINLKVIYQYRQISFRLQQTTFHLFAIKFISRAHGKILMKQIMRINDEI